jgi:hypothetical protein
MNKQSPRFLSKSAVGRRLDLPAKSVERAIQAGALIPFGFLNGSPIFREDEILQLATDLVSRAKIVGA